MKMFSTQRRALAVTACLLVYCTNLTFGCRCFFPHAQMSFCDADYGIKGEVVDTRIIGEGEINGEAENKIKVLEDYKGLPDEYVSVEGGETYVKVHTYLGTGACGAGVLDEGTEYFLTGAAYDGMLHFSICDEGGKMENQDRNMVNRLKNLDCDDCQIVPVKFATTPDTCYDEQTNWGSANKNKDSVCVRNSAGVCLWETA